MYNNRDNNILIKTYPLWIKDFNFSEKISSVVFEEIVEKENSFFIQIKINENALYKIELASFYEKKTLPAEVQKINLNSTLIKLPVSVKSFMLGEAAFQNNSWQLFNSKWCKI